MQFPKLTGRLDLFVQILIEVVTIGLVFRYVLLNGKHRIANLHRQSVDQVQQAGLAHVFSSRTRLTDLGFLVAHLVARTPSKRCEWPLTDLAFGAILLFHHSNVRIITQTGRTKNRKVRILHRSAVPMRNASLKFGHFAGFCWPFTGRSVKIFRF